MKNLIFILLVFLLYTHLKAQWEPCNNGLYDFSNIRTIAVSGNNIIAGTGGAGIFLSTDNGKNWTQKNNGLKDLYVSFIAVNGNNIYACFCCFEIYLSTNN